MIELGRVWESSGQSPLWRAAAGWSSSRRRSSVSRKKRRFVLCQWGRCPLLRGVLGPGADNPNLCWIEGGRYPAESLCKRFNLLCVKSRHSDAIPLGGFDFELFVRLSIRQLHPKRWWSGGSRRGPLIVVICRGQAADLKPPCCNILQRMQNSY